MKPLFWSTLSYLSLETLSIPCLVFPHLPSHCHHMRGRMTQCLESLTFQPALYLQLSEIPTPLASGKITNIQAKDPYDQPIPQYRSECLRTKLCPPLVPVTVDPHNFLSPLWPLILALVDIPGYCHLCFPFYHSLGEIESLPQWLTGCSHSDVSLWPTSFFRAPNHLGAPCENHHPSKLNTNRAVLPPKYATHSSFSIYE